ncbi:hypothetical protein [Burkholderia sp. Bp9090]|nr:hypothetical protein [Burkholderia sp. Bp9090]
MSDLLLAILIGTILIAFGAALWATTQNEARLSHWFQEHHLRDLIHRRH